MATEAKAAPPIVPDIVDDIGDQAGVNALVSLNRAEIDVQIATAKRYPRSIVAFQQQAMEMATLDEETAASMFYALPRGGKTIEGPSVRLAEIVGSAWGNLHYGARALDAGPNDRFVVAQGMAWDLEKNVKIQFEVRRRITDSKGRRYNDDMIGVAGSAGSSIALRNAIFKVVPFAYVKRIYEEAKLVSIGKALTMEQRRTRAFEWFQKVGVRQEQIMKLLGRKGVDDITVDDLITLNGLKTAIKDGDTTVDDVFRDAPAQKPAAAPEGTPADPLVAAAAGKSVEKATPPASAAPAPADAIPVESTPVEVASHSEVEIPTEVPAATVEPAAAPTACNHESSRKYLQKSKGRPVVCADCPLEVNFDAFGKIVPASEA